VCSGDSWTTNVNAETLSLQVPDDMIVDMKLCDEEALFCAAYEAFSVSRRETAC